MTVRDPVELTRAQAWTKLPPVKPGYYFRRCLNVSARTVGRRKRGTAPPPVLVEVVRRFDGDLWMIPLWPSDVPPWNLSNLTEASVDDEWAGPYEPPE